MKKLLLGAIFMVSSAGLFAQYIEVKEGSKSMKEGTYNSYTVSLEDISFKEAEEEWKQFMKDHKAKVKHDKKAKVHFSDNVNLPSISSNPVDLYAMINEDERDNLTTVTVWFDTGNGYVNSIDMELQSEVAEKMMSEYGLKVMKKHANEVLDNEEKELKKLQDELKKLSSKNKDLLKKISEAKENIMKWEKELEQNDHRRAIMNNDIEDQKKEVDSANAKARKFI